jgi:hypothetical protein
VSQKAEIKTKAVHGLVEILSVSDAADLSNLSTQLVNHSANAAIGTAGHWFLITVDTWFLLMGLPLSPITNRVMSEEPKAY